MPNEQSVKSPGPADLWNERDAAPRRGPAIAPIWVLVGISVVLLGVLFGQMFAAPSVAAAQEPPSTPEPVASNATYGSNGGDGSETPPPTPLPSALPAKAPSSNTARSYAATGGSGDSRYAAEQQIAQLKFPSAAQLYVPAVTPTDAPYGTTTDADSTKVVTVYSRATQGAAGGATRVPYPLLVAQGATKEGDTQQTQEGAETDLQQMPSEVETPAPVDIPASTRVPAQLNVPTDSDLLGPVRVQLSEDVCDPRTGALAWPRGMWFTGHLEPVLFRDQRHLAFNWDYMTFPDLTKRSLGNGIVTEDEEGHSGIAGRRNMHTWSIFRDTLVGSISGAAGNILTALAQRANTTAPIVVTPGQSSGYGQTSTVEMPTIEVGRSIPIELVLTADYTANKPYDEPGWQGCRS